MKTNFDVEEAVDEFMKSLECPDPQTCEIQPEEEFYINFPKQNDIVFQNSDQTNKHTKRIPFINETTKSTGNI